jgi:hypothetical protein
MEETDVCYLTPTLRSLQQAIPNGCAAKALGPSQRLTIGVQALASAQSVSGLAQEYEVSRKFVYQQAATAQAALDEAFTAAAADDQVLGSLPITKNWLRQATLGLILICHSSYRGVVEFYRDLLGIKLSVGTVHNIVHDAVAQARVHNLSQDLAAIDMAGLDEIFQNRQPILVGADVASSYCFLLSQEEHCDAETWGVRLLEAQERGLAPRGTVADFGTALRAGQKLALPEVPCRGDVFHALQEATLVVSYLENRAYEAIAAEQRLEHTKARSRQQGRSTQALGRASTVADQAQTAAIALADDVALLTRWLREDVLAVSALAYADRCALFDFIVAQLQARAALCQQLGPLSKRLKKHRAQLLAFAAQLDQDLVNLAAQFEVAPSIVRELLDLHTRAQRQPRRWPKEAALRQQLGRRFYQLNEAVRDLVEHVVRASSVIENINSRLRSYFFLRRQLGADYLTLLQFFLNHRRFLRSEHPQRVGKSPAELLTGQSHAHWLELLGYTRSSQN